MPELPEVETIRRQLHVLLRGKRIVGLDVRLAKLVKTPLQPFKRAVLGARIISIRRRAKVLIVDLSNHRSILLHLKMTGQLVYRKRRMVRTGGHPIAGTAQDLPSKYSHIIFTFADKAELFFNDIRQFGYLKLIKTADIEKYFLREGYGPEPLSRDFTEAVFAARLNARGSQRIKPLLMDQTFVAGVGNIYATEACFTARVLPQRTARSLTQPEIKKLYRAIRSILAAALAVRGSSADTYVDAFGQPGQFVPSLRVYGREGKACKRCGNKIKTFRLGGRGTAYCPECQR